MQTRVEETLKRHDRGFNCAQSVACTYCDLVGVEEEMMFRVTEAFGAGMGGMEGTCGAVSGACVLAGMKASTGNLEKPNSKAVSHQLAKEILSWMKKDVNNLEWTFNSFPGQQFKDDFGNALLEYVQGSKDWSHVEKTFRTSWKNER